MPRKSQRLKQKPLVVLNPHDAVAQVQAGKRVWVDLVQTAAAFGLQPADMVPALQSGELVAMRKPGKRNIKNYWKNFALASDTVIAWIAKRGLIAVRPEGTALH